MTVIDSNVWIARLLQDDTLHARARAVLTDATHPLLIHEYILIEVCALLVRRGFPDRARDFITFARANTDVKILFTEPAWTIAFLSFFQQTNQRGLSFIDTGLLFLSKTYPVITFDKKLARAIARERH